MVKSPTPYLAEEALDVVLGGIYATVGLGMQGASLGSARQMLSCVATVRAPVCVMGDFNMTPDELQLSGVLQGTGLDIMLPRDTELTCTSGHGRMLDYALVDHKLKALIHDFALDPTTPWRPHSGLRLAIKARPRQVLVRALARAPCPVAVGCGEAFGAGRVGGP